MVLVGLTGGIGAGKSTVSKMLASAGCKIIDADRVAREVVKPGTRGLDALCREFGRDILLAGGELNRARLARIIFSDSSARNRLNKILHPLILETINGLIKEYRKNCPSDIIVVDAPLLLETGMDRDMDHVILVHATEECRIKRIMARDNLGRDEARQRICSQIPLEDALKRADFVIDNGGTREKTLAQVKEVLARIREGGEKL